MLALCPSASAGALGATHDLFVEAGRGDAAINEAGLGYDQEVARWRGLEAGTFLEGDLEYWRSTFRGDGARYLVTPGVLATERFQHLFGLPDLTGEIGVGGRLLSHVELSGGHDYSTAYQFQEVVGLRCNIDPSGDAFFALRGRHVSNGGLRQPNPGINSVMVLLGVNY